MMLTFGCSEMGCICGECAAKAKERRRLAEMTFAERKAERTVKRLTPLNLKRPRAPWPPTDTPSLKDLHRG